MEGYGDIEKEIYVEKDFDTDTICSWNKFVESEYLVPNLT